MKKNEIYEMTITGMGAEGEGVGRIDSFVVFVPFALIGEFIRVQILKVTKSYAHGKLLDILTPSPHRVTPECRYFAKCGGCALWHMDYQSELQYKTQKVKDALIRIGKIDIEVPDTLSSGEFCRYRNKALFPVSVSGVGLFAPRSHRLIKIESCLIQDNITDKIIKIIDASGIIPYDEVTHSGEVRHILIRKGNGIMVCIVTRTPEFLGKDELINELSKLDNVKSIIQNINPNKTNVALGGKNVTLWGDEFVTTNLFNLTFKVSPNTFFQVNTAATHILYETAKDFAELDGTQNVLDLYCGIGTISLYFSQWAKHVTGVEIVPQSVENARKNAVLNNIQNATFELGSAKDFSNTRFYEVVVLDPPRKGCDLELINSLINLKSSKIVYISCNPSTLARDLNLLSAVYDVKKVQPVDLFPRTPHVETVVLLQKRCETTAK